jgi:hypothetical protein
MKNLIIWLAMLLPLFVSFLAVPNACALTLILPLLNTSCGDWAIAADIVLATVIAIVYVVTYAHATEGSLWAIGTVVLLHFWAMVALLSIAVFSGMTWCIAMTIIAIAINQTVTLSYLQMYEARLRA